MGHIRRCLTCDSVNSIAYSIVGRNQSINQYLIYNALVYNKSLSVKTVGLLNSQERGYYFRLVTVKSASEEVRLELCLEGR